MTALHSKTLYLFIICLFSYRTLFACSCSIATTEEEYKRSELVVKGKIVGADTIIASNNMVFDSHGVKYGNHKYSLYFQKLLRIKFVVEANYKSTTQVPDTIFILTSTQSSACGYPFPPYLNQLSSPYYDFIIYGDCWIGYSTQDSMKGKRTIKQIKKVTSSNTFFTSSCRLTQYSNEAELTKLEKLKS